MGSRFRFIACAAGLLALTSGTANADAPAKHHGDMLLQIEASPDEVHALGLDVWTHSTSSPRVLTRVTALQRATLDASGLQYIIVDPNLGVQLDAEVARLNAVVQPTAGGGLDPSFYEDYRPLDVVFDQLAALTAAYPDRVAIVEVGTSLEGRPIRGVRITNPGGPDDRPVVVVQACMHAREWVSVSSAMYAAERFAEASEGGLLNFLLDETELVIVPVVNPDGYVYSWDEERLWRKNRRDEHGVDLNRNWSVAWGGDGSSGIPDEGNYRGTAPFSEPESTAMRDFISADPDTIAMLDVHAFGQFLLYPWGFDYVDSGDDVLFEDLAQDMSDSIFQVNSQWYQPLQSSDFYPAAGNAIDWAYGVEGLYSVTIELRPTFESREGFVLGPEHIVPTGEELVAGIAELMESSIALGPGEPGDSGGAVDDGDPPGDTTNATDDGSTDTGPIATDDGDSDGASDGQTSGPTPSDSGPLPGGTAGNSTGSDGTDSDGGQAGEPSGCSCKAGDDQRSGAAWWLLGLIGFVGRRRR